MLNPACCFKRDVTFKVPLYRGYDPLKPDDDDKARFIFTGKFCPYEEQRSNFIRLCDLQARLVKGCANYYKKDRSWVDTLKPSTNGQFPSPGPFPVWNDAGALIENGGKFLLHMLGIEYNGLKKAVPQNDYEVQFMRYFGT